MTGKIGKIYIFICVLASVAAIVLFALINPQPDHFFKVGGGIQKEDGQMGDVPDQKGSGYGTLSLLHEETISSDSIEITLAEDVTQTDITIDGDYMQKSVVVSIESAELAENYYTFFEANPIKENMDISDLDITATGKRVQIRFLMSQIYAYNTKFEQNSDQNALIIQFTNPKVEYGKVVVLDAGHGGDDVGVTGRVSSEDETYSGTEIKEKELTLEIVEVVGQLLYEEDIQVYYTRTDDTNISADDRVALANDLQADMLISIHADESEDTSVYGMRATYNGTFVIPDSSA